MVQDACRAGRLDGSMTEEMWQGGGHGSWKRSNEVNEGKRKYSFRFSLLASLLRFQDPWPP
jgi:hypothetical protein